jgi:hypothetical protein
VRIVAATVLVTLLAGCGHARRAQPAVSADGKAVIRDAYDGRLDRDWTCGSLRAAVRRLPSDGAYSTIALLIGRATGHACDAAFSHIKRGSTRMRVRALLGPPDRAPRCWLYRWPPDTGSAVDGARICFAGPGVSLVQTAVHG